MASYHCSVKVGGKGKASGHAAYIARDGHYAERAGYEDLEATGYDNLPAWAEGEPARFWFAADRHGAGRPGPILALTRTRERGHER